MTIPLVCFILGTLVFGWGVLAYGLPLSREIPEGRKRSDFFTCLTSHLLIAFALMLGLVGYLSHLNSNSLRYARIAMGITAIVLLSYQFLELASRP
ncbi:MAG TPA: hypothetical protein V6C57_25065 [Coleofasciculaceae cyanobacterium]